MNGHQSSTCSRHTGLRIKVPDANSAIDEIEVNTSARAPRDTTPPTMNCPQPITAECGSPDGTPVIFQVSANDPCDGPVAPSCTPPAGTTFPPGTPPRMPTAIRAAARSRSRCLVADGLASSDPEGDALAYLWWLLGDPVPFGAGPVVTNCLEVGEHTLNLAVTIRTA
jgi:hypothetical protein